MLDFEHPYESVDTSYALQAVWITAEEAHLAVSVREIGLAHVMGGETEAD